MNNNKYDCSSCQNTGHHKKELGNYCLNCKWGELLIKESTRLFIENHKKFVENMMPHVSYTEEIEKIKNESINHLNQK